MAEITVRAIDSALAMEEVQKRLGDDALIISTQRIDGQIEITATDEEVVKPNKETKPLILGDIYRQDNFSAVLNRKVGEARNSMDLNIPGDLYPEVTNRIEKISESIDSLNPFEEKRDIFATSVLADSVSLQFDSEGRVSIPSKLLEHAKIKQTILFVGQGKTFQIWEPKLFEKFKTQARKKANLSRASLQWENQFKKEGK